MLLFTVRSELSINAETRVLQQTSELIPYPLIHPSFSHTPPPPRDAECALPVLARGDVMPSK